MNQFIHRLLPAVMSAAMVLGAATGVSAAAATDYSVNVIDGGVQFLKEGKVVATHATLTDDVTLKMNTKGSLLVSFTRDTEVTANITLGKQTDLAIGGDMDSLTLDKTLKSAKTPTVTGTVGTLTVSAPTELIIGKTAKVDVLKVTDSKAEITVQSGATVGAAYASNRKTITGLTASKVKGLSSAPKENTTASATVDKPSNVGKKSVQLEMEDRNREKTYNKGKANEYTKDLAEYNKELSYDDKTITMVAKPGITLGTALRDIKISVRRGDDNDKTVPGSWKWMNTTADTKKSGIYYYRFTPSDSSYETVQLTVHFTSSGETSGLSKPSIDFEDGQRSHGAAGSVSIEVGIPAQVVDDDILYIYVNNKEVEKVDLNEGDAAETESFTVNVSGDSGDKIKIKAKVKRAVGGSSATSETIKYEID